MIFWKSYRDELTAISLVLGLSVIGVFFVASRFYVSYEGDGTSVSVEKNESEILGESIQEAVDAGLRITPTSIVLPSPTPTVTPGPMDTEVLYGIGGSYAFEDFELVFNNPRIIFNLEKSESRSFVVDVVIRNVKIEGGIVNRLTAAIVKDGNIIVSDAALSISESRRIYPEEQLTFEARLSLIDGTDVRELKYKTDTSANKVIHELQTVMGNEE